MTSRQVAERIVLRGSNLRSHGFARSRFCEAIASDEPTEVTVTASLVSGQQFYGKDTIKVIDHSFKHLARLASRWLEGGCGSPDWCGGLDLDRDSMVNFVDFAMFDGCCVEVVKE